MKTYCENPSCETQAVKEVSVSVNKPGDQKRSLCATCAEAYTWGVQHGRKNEQMFLAVVERFLQKHGFVIIGRNQDDPHPKMPFEAWAYHGSLDFNEATPVAFGLGHNVIDSLAALNRQLKKSGNVGKAKLSSPGLSIDPSPKDSGPEPIWRVVYTIDVNAPDARGAAKFVQQIMMDPNSLAPVFDILDAKGKVTRVDLSGDEFSQPQEDSSHE